ALLEHVGAARGEFDRLVLDVRQVLQPPEEVARKVGSVRDIETLLQTAAEQHKLGEEIRQRAMQALERVLALVYRGGAPFQPLIDCQARARELRKALRSATGLTLPADARPLADGSHPFACLLKLVDSWQHLETDHWTEHQDRVSQAFGRSLSAAAARGHLVLQESFPTMSEPPAVSVPRPAPPPPSPPAPKPSLPETKKAASGLTSAPPSPPRAPESFAIRAASPKAEPRPVPVTRSKAAPPAQKRWYDFAAGTSAQQIARELLKRTPAER